MKTHNDLPYAALDKLFHEPNRLAILSALGGAIDGLTFNEIKEKCGLTDGNLSRHLKTLEDAGAIRIKKSRLGKRSSTRAVLSELGSERFIVYLKALEEVLVKASRSVVAEEKAAAFRSLWESQFGAEIFDMD
jgi:DNA-binding transcriptional ArsR family regulator